MCVGEGFYGEKVRVESKWVDKRTCTYVYKKRIKMMTDMNKNAEPKDQYEK
jgi:hypothetical protein